MLSSCGVFTYLRKRNRHCPPRTERERTLVTIRSWTLPSKGAGAAHMYQLSAIDEVDGALALMFQVALERVSRRVLLRRVRSFWRLALVLCSAEC